MSQLQWRHLWIDSLQWDSPVSPWASLQWDCDLLEVKSLIFFISLHPEPSEVPSVEQVFNKYVSNRRDGKWAKGYHSTEEREINSTWAIQEGFQEEMSGGGHGDEEGPAELKKEIQKVDWQT